MIFKTSGGQNQLIKNLSNKQKGCSELPIAFKGECRKSRGFPGLSAVKNPPANVGNARDASLIPGLGRSPGEGNGSSLQYSCLKIPWTEDLGGLCQGGFGVMKSQTQLSN